MKLSFKGFGRRALSMLLMLMTLMSICALGISSASAAEAEIAEVGWSTNDTFYCLSGLNSGSNQYGIVDANKMTKNASSKKYQTVYTGVSTDNSFYFRLYDGNQYLIPYNDDGRTITPSYESGYNINQQNDKWGFKTSGSHNDKTWEFAMDNLSATYSTVTVYIEFQINDNGSGYIHLWVTDGVQKGSGGGGGQQGGSELSGETKTVYVGVYDDFLSQHFMPTLHWWNDSINKNGDVALVSADVDAKFVVGDSYWNGVAQTFHIYTAEVPVEAIACKTFKQSSNNCWASESFNIADGKILLCFHYSNAYHNFTADYDAATGSYFADIWVDTNENFGDNDPETNDIDLLKAEKSGSTYILYLPSGTDRTAIRVYHRFNSLTIGGVSITSGNTYNLSLGNQYSLGGDLSGSLKIYQSQGVATLYTNTKKAMPTTIGAYAHKDDYTTSGTYMKAKADGTIELNEAELKKIKGRGNSSWQASNEKYGKYSFNATLKDKAVLIAGGQKCKKYSILANNADESRMRNMVAYSLSNAIGINYTTTFEQVDMYNNHKYIGSYMICYKVEIGKPLVNIYDLEGANEELTDNAFVYTDGEYSQGYSGGSGVNDTSTKGFYKYINNMSTPEYYQGGYLLEFELNERFADELCGFISNKGQQIVCKYPEFCSKTEVQFISGKWNEAEALMYNTSATYEQLNAVIDVESFAKMYLIQELTKNLDGCATSYYVSYDKDGKFRASCAWDYDWTLGQYEGAQKTVKSSTHQRFSSSQVDAATQNATGWFEAVKTIYKNTSEFNAQAALCQNNNFWNVVKTEWNQLFYETAQTYAENGNISSTSSLTGSINEFYNQIKSSIAMDEVRWGFIASDPLTSWGSKNTGATFDAAVIALNNWYYTRLNWMNDRLNTTDYTLPKPSIKADKTSYIVGDEVTLTAKTNAAGTVVYYIYNAADDTIKTTLTSSTGSATYTYTAAAPGDASYYVKVAGGKGTTPSVQSDNATVHVDDYTLNVSLKAKTANVEAGYNATLTATSNAIDSATYKLYDSSDNLIDQNTTGKFTAPVGDVIGSTKSFYVVATTTYQGSEYTATSATVTVNVVAVQAQYTVNVYFKSTGTYGYEPIFTTTGCVSDLDEAEMTRDSFIGTNKTQTAKYYWYKAEVAVSKENPTVSFNFVSKRYAMEGTIRLTIEESGNYYFGIDNLNNGTTVYNLTDKTESERNWFKSAAHMVYDSKYDGVLPVSANVELVRVGDADCDGQINIKDATYIQKVLAGICTLDVTGKAVADVDCDGTVTIKDATLLQKQIAALL